ncbi:hypothetical protein Pmani_013823 [Petrolisthes manimaculis]|uniref:Uncharacterized protein n=1 Tax=Petrolisthes manimaculis TaxID=1843537 RepID=A0AAE1PWQ7_9EUCA|nr:hypothetical protein Pmani_013823 [Petrolisthes manimaculis]
MVRGKEGICEGFEIMNRGKKTAQTDRQMDGHTETQMGVKYLSQLQPHLNTNTQPAIRLNSDTWNSVSAISPQHQKPSSNRKKSHVLASATSQHQHTAIRLSSVTKNSVSSQHQQVILYSSPFEPHSNRVICLRLSHISTPSPSCQT